MSVTEAARRVALVNLGCRVNRVELDAMALALQEAGCVICDKDQADAIVVNTCAVTGEAQAKTRKAVRRAAKLPQEPLVVATGCVASLFADELTALDSSVIVEADKSKVTDIVLAGLASRPVRQEGEISLDSRPTSDVKRERTTPTGRTRPGIKIQDGCDNRCTFCIVWKARGHSRSKDVAEVLAEVRAAQARGAHEIVLTGINLGNYRWPREGGRTLDLPGLLEILLEETDVERIRLSSIEPPDVTSHLVATMAQAGDRIAPFLHICLQSGCDRTLREMGRVYDTAVYRQTVRMARDLLPDLSLGCDLIVGFPGETDQDFDQSYAFCQQMDFSRMHVFRYSRRPGTPAAARPDQVDPTVSARRSLAMLDLAAQMRLAQARRRIGQEDLVVVQSPGRGVTGGLFDAAVSPDHPLDALVRVRVSGVADDGLLLTQDWAP